MKYYGYHYEYITIYSDGILFFRMDTTGTLRGLNTVLPLKGVLYPEFYPGCWFGNRRNKWWSNACLLGSNIHQKCEWEDWEDFWYQNKELWITAWGGLSSISAYLWYNCRGWSIKVKHDFWMWQLFSNPWEVWCPIFRIYHGEVQFWNNEGTYWCYS